MRRLHADLAISGVLTLVGTAMAIYSLRYGVFDQGGRIGPGFMPLVAGVALAVFSAWSCAGIVLRDRGTATAAAPLGVGAREQASAGYSPAAEPPASGEEAPASGEEPDSAQASPATRRGRKVVLVFALTAGAIAITPITGFLLAFGLLIVVLLAMVEREPRWLALGVAAAVVAVSWLVFVRVLGVPLPGGVLNLLGT